MTAYLLIACFVGAFGTWIMLPRKLSKKTIPRPDRDETRCPAERASRWWFAGQIANGERKVEPGGQGNPIQAASAPVSLFGGGRRLVVHIVQVMHQALRIDG
jgi:hypothetical protein